MSDDKDFQSWDMPKLGDSRVVNLTVNSSREKDRIAQEQEAIRQRAHDEGYQHGLQQALQEQEQTKQQLNHLLSLLDKPLQLIDEQVFNYIERIIITLTSKCIAREITLKPEIISDLLQQLVDALPSSLQDCRLVMHPDDMALMTLATQQEFAELRFVEDPLLKRGEARLISETTEIDGRLESRLATLEEKLEQAQDDGV